MNKSPRNIIGPISEDMRDLSLTEQEAGRFKGFNMESLRDLLAKNPSDRVLHTLYEQVGIWHAAVDRLLCRNKQAY